MPLRVMIVEDEMLLALDLEDMLLDAGYTVVGQASDMPQAIALAEKVSGGSSSPALEHSIPVRQRKP